MQSPLHVQGDPEPPPAGAPGGEAVHVRRVRQVLHPVHAAACAHVLSHRRLRLQMQILRHEVQPQTQVSFILMCIILVEIPGDAQDKKIIITSPAHAPLPLCRQLKSKVDKVDLKKIYYIKKKYLKFSLNFYF